MKKCYLLFSVIAAALIVSCKNNSKVPAAADIASIGLRQGSLISCGPPDQQFGKVNFANSCSLAVQPDFNTAIALPHSFEYEEAEKLFASIINREPGCAMAYWGVALSNYHQVWPSPPSPAELGKGSKAIAIAQSITHKTDREMAYINAIAEFYRDWQHRPHNVRSLAYMKAMETVHRDYATDPEAAIFYALSLDAAADPADKTYRFQRKAGELLSALYPGEPHHPGIAHSLIHSYDYPELAAMALPAARAYAGIAPSSAHALHMPSPIFTRLGLWEECIQSNIRSVDAARCYAAAAKMQGHWDEELHGLDYLVYAYLQEGDDRRADSLVQYTAGFYNVYPANFKVAYAFAAIPARYCLENKLWGRAAVLEAGPAGFPWQEFPWQRSIIYCTRLLGAVQDHRPALAEAALDSLRVSRDTLLARKDSYKANQVAIQYEAGKGWLLFLQHKNNVAVQQMVAAVKMENHTAKSPVAPGEVLPASEQLGELLLRLHRSAAALAAFEADLA